MNAILKKLSVPDVNSILLATVILNTIYPTIMHVKGGGRFMPITLEKKFLSKELEGKARTRPVVLGPYVQY